jgi:hypothetical protein
MRSNKFVKIDVETVLSGADPIFYGYSMCILMNIYFYFYDIAKTYNVIDGVKDYSLYTTLPLHKSYIQSDLKLFVIFVQKHLLEGSSVDRNVPALKYIL